MTSYHLIVLAIMIFNGYHDLKERQIFDFPIIITLFAGIFLSDLPFLCLLAAFAFLIASLSDVKIPQWGDIETLILLFTACGPGLGLIAILTLILLIPWKLATKTPSIPLVTLLAVAYIIWLFI